MKIKEKLKDYLSGKYKVITAYNAEEEQESCIAINISSLQNLYHGNKFDFEYTITITGFTFIEDDKTGEIRDEMAEYTVDKMKNYQSDDVAGVLIDNLEIETEETIHSFNLKIKLYIIQE